MLVLGALRLFPVGLIAGAVLLPLVTLLYLWDTDIYEDEPMQVVDPDHGVGRGWPGSSLGLDRPGR